MHLLDRMLIRGYLKAYVVCLVSLLSLYVVIDLFTNLDEFAEQHRGLVPVSSTLAFTTATRLHRFSTCCARKSSFWQRCLPLPGCTATMSCCRSYRRAYPPTGLSVLCF